MRERAISGGARREARGSIKLEGRRQCRNSLVHWQRHMHAPTLGPYLSLCVAPSLGHNSDRQRSSKLLAARSSSPPSPSSSTSLAAPFIKLYCPAKRRRRKAGESGLQQFSRNLRLHRSRLQAKRELFLATPLSLLAQLSPRGRNISNLARFALGRATKVNIVKARSSTKASTPKQSSGDAVCRGRRGRDTR